MSNNLKDQITANIETIHSEVAAMCNHTGLPNPTPRLIAVSKIQPKERIIAALEAGQRIFGENRVQEAEERWSELKNEYEGLELHLIGSLQTNKASNAVALFDEIQTVDRIKLARALAKEMEKQNRQLPIYVQVNTGKEEQKGGCMVEDLAELLEECGNLGLTVKGLMCIPPVGDDPSLHFALMRKLGRTHGITKLSMGMSKDYALATSMGATDIRVGTSIFGERDYAAKA